MLVLRTLLHASAYKYNWGQNYIYRTRDINRKNACTMHENQNIQRAARFEAFYRVEKAAWRRPRAVLVLPLLVVCVLGVCRNPYSVCTNRLAWKNNVFFSLSSLSTFSTASKKLFDLLGEMLNLASTRSAHTHTQIQSASSHFKEFPEFQLIWSVA